MTNMKLAGALAAVAVATGAQGAEQQLYTVGDLHRMTAASDGNTYTYNRSNTLPDTIIITTEKDGVALNSQSYTCNRGDVTKAYNKAHARKEELVSLALTPSHARKTTYNRDDYARADDQERDVLARAQACGIWPQAALNK